MKICKILFFFLGTMLFGLTAAQANAAVLVIANQSAAVEQVNTETIKRLYLSKVKKISGNKALIFPVDQTETSPVRDEFNQKVMQMSVTGLRKYWSKRIFTGKGGPPKIVTNDEEVKSLVRSNPNIIGYIDARAFEPDLKILLAID